MSNSSSYSLDLFEKFLHSRGLSRVRVDHGGNPSYLPIQSMARAVGDSNLDEFCTQINMPTSSDVQNSREAEDPDKYYCSEELRTSIRDRAFDPRDDSFYSFEYMKKSREEENDHSQESLNKNPSAMHQALGENEESDSACDNHGVHDSRFFPMNCSRSASSFSEGIDDKGDYGLNELESCSFGSPTGYPHSPASKFCDSILLTCQSIRKLQGLSSSLKYKNNITAIIRATDGIDHFLVCCGSQILVFEFDEMNCPETEPLLSIETRPAITSVNDRLSSTWPYCPHTINSITVSTNWVNGSVVSICADDGRILIWNVNNLVNQFKLIKLKSEASRHGVLLKCDFSLKLNASAWGIDFRTTVESSGSKHHVIAASANTKTITLFYFHEILQQFYNIETHPVLHNIPEVSFVEYTINGGRHQALLSCATIFGELLTFKVEFAVSQMMADSSFSMNAVVNFERPYVVRRTCLGSDCWTTKPVHSRYFKKVQSWGAMTGNYNIDESSELSRISAESRIFSSASMEASKSDFCTAGQLQYFETPVINLDHPCQAHKDPDIKFCSLQEDCSRMHSVIKKLEDHNRERDVAPSEGVFLAVSTDRRLGLFEANSLLCIASTKAVFNLDSLDFGDNKWCNRISITEVIPELSAFIAVTQSGLVTILRLCEHRGVYGMRQEHLFPNTQKLDVSEGKSRSMIGICVRNLSPSQSQPRFLLYLIYSDGLTLVYELKQRATM